MRYPIYFFLLLSGFFYLTGKPLDDKAAQTADVTHTKGQPLAYARRTGPKPVATPDTAKPVVMEQVATAAVAVKETSSDPARKTFAVAPAKQVAIKAPARVLQEGWRTSAAQPAQNPSSAKIVTTAKKTLDWTVFGNERKTVSGTFPTRTVSKDEMDAQSIPAEALVAAGSRKKIRKSRKARSAKRRLARKARKSRSLRKKRSRRFARLNRRSKGAYRVARRARKKSAKKSYSYKPRRKKFGFRSSGGAMTIGF